MTPVFIRSAILLRAVTFVGIKDALQLYDPMSLAGPRFLASSVFLMPAATLTIGFFWLSEWPLLRYLIGGAPITSDVFISNLKIKSP